MLFSFVITIKSYNAKQIRSSPSWTLKTLTECYLNDSVHFFQYLYYKSCLSFNNFFYFPICVPIKLHLVFQPSAHGSLGRNWAIMLGRKHGSTDIFVPMLNVAGMKITLSIGTSFQCRWHMAPCIDDINLWESFGRCIIIVLWVSFKVYSSLIDSIHSLVKVFYQFPVNNVDPNIRDRE